MLELAELVRRYQWEEMELDTPEGENNKGLTLAADLDRARRRIQGNVLKDFGVVNDLWGTALRMLSFSRNICQTEIAKSRSTPSDENKPPVQNGSTPNGKSNMACIGYFQDSRLHLVNWRPIYG